MKLLVNILSTRAIAVSYCKRKWRRAKATPAQNANHDRLRDANRYASRQMMDPTSRCEYEMGITRKYPSAHQVARNDYLKAPEVHGIDATEYRGRKGDLIVVHASDDFMVKGVKVSVIGSNGHLLEEGQAVEDPARLDCWNYVTTAANHRWQGTTIRATAFDKPGNTTTREVAVHSHRVVIQKCPAP